VQLSIQVGRALRAWVEKRVSPVKEAAVGHQRSAKAVSAEDQLKVDLYGRALTNDHSTENQLLELRRYVRPFKEHQSGCQAWTVAMRSPPEWFVLSRVNGKGQSAGRRRVDTKEIRPSASHSTPAESLSAA